MKMDEEQKLLETLIDVFDDLQSFLIHKNHQHIIFAFLQLKRLMKSGTQSSKMSAVGRRSAASFSQKNYSERKRATSGISAKKSLGKQSHASFDIIKGAEFFNENKKSKPHYQKQYTEVSRYQRPYMDNQIQEPTRFTGPYINSSKEVTRRNNTSQIVPRLVGLVSSEEEISDIERLSRRSYHVRGNERIGGRGLDYQRSIMEVDGDDDEFEDVVLNRLDQIQEQVNQMFKRKQRFHDGNVSIQQQRPPLSSIHQYQTRFPLQNANLRSNNIHTQPMRGHRNSEFHKYQQPLYNFSSQQMMPNSNVLYSFKNTKKNSYVGQNNRVLESNGIKGQFTERAHKLSSKILAQMPRYAAGNQQYVQGYHQSYRHSNPVGHEGQKIIFYEERLPQVVQEQNITKSKRLGHYRDSTGTLRLTFQEQSHQIPPLSRDQQIIQKQWSNSRLRQEAYIDGQNVYKYIPMARYVPEKTQRHVITRRVERRGQEQTGDERQGHYRVGKVVFIDKLGGEIVRRNRNDDHSSQHAHQIKDDLYYKREKNSAFLQRPLDNNKFKAYTDQGDFIPRPDDFSVSSDGGIHSEIRQLRETTKHYGSGKVDKRESYLTRKADKDQLIVQKQIPRDGYRYHQKTERNKGLLPRKYSQHTGGSYVGQVFVEKVPSEERLYKIVKQVREGPQFVEKRFSSRNSDIQGQGKHQRFEEFVPTEEEAVYRSRTSNGSSMSNQQAYFIRENSQVYEKIKQSHVAQNHPKAKQFHTIIRKDSNLLQKKISGDSVHTFKSIPFIRLQSRKNTIQEMLQKSKNIEKISQQQSNHQDEQENQEEEI